MKKEREILKYQFKKKDLNKNGTIDYIYLMNMLKETFGVNYAKIQCKRIFANDAIDSDEDIDFNEFLMAWLSKYKQIQDNSLRLTFE